MTRLEAEMVAELDVAEARAWDALGRYKFQMFGYWAAIWVHLNRIGGFKRSNPWAALVSAARNRNAPLDRIVDAFSLFDEPTQ